MTPNSLNLLAQPQAAIVVGSGVLLGIWWLSEVEIGRWLLWFFRLPIRWCLWGISAILQSLIKSIDGLVELCNKTAEFIKRGGLIADCLGYFILLFWCHGGVVKMPNEKS